ncbi:FtsK/SpoIIIE domain-containing protein [Turicibacter sp.]|uniref:FtsK/SpoIIIE domain-containing protein n=1 Tax=Turicibacter sp. TaxID=2049042 RepID=UPI001B4491BA|nr:FtsK/SpoIIIE domain-containing protein [Turicibacter sp.]MBP3903563.1 DNA translocase FtsK [Turicibacter sp.]MBP3907455.1 DNA translocase FtsK [Turicibacter sp.]
MGFEGFITVAAIMVFTSLISKKEKEKDKEIVQLNQFFKSSDLYVKKGDQIDYAYCYKKNEDELFENYYIYIPQFKSFKDLERLQSVLENHFKKTVKCEITNNFEYILKVTKDNIKKLETMLLFKLVNVSKTSELCFCIGKSLHQYEYINFSKIPNLLVAGATGWGKSFCIKSIIAQLIHNYNDNVEMILIDLKGGVELGMFESVKQTTFFTFKPWECEKILKETFEEIEERLDKFRKLNVKNISEFNQKSDEKMKFKIVIIEEFTILMDYSKEIFDVLTKSLAISRATGIYYIFTSQRFDSKIIDSRIKANVDNRICFHTADSINSKLILDDSGAEKLDTKGRAILNRAGEKVEFQSFYITDKDVQKVVNANLKQNKTILEPSNKNKANNKGKGLKGITEPLVASDGVIERMI